MIKSDNCIVCSENNCQEKHCKDLLKSIEEIKINHSLENIIKEIYG